MILGIKISGTAGQGVVLIGEILAYCAVLEGKEGAAIGSYGAAVRGGTASVDVSISDNFIPAPFVKIPDYLILLSQAGYETLVARGLGFGISETPVAEEKPRRYIFFDPDTVKTDEIPGIAALFGRDFVRQIPIPAQAIALDKLKTRLSANMVMLGAFCGFTGIVSQKSGRQAIKEKIKKYTEINLQGFILGYELGERMKGEK